MIPAIETVAIGDELLTGRIADTNSAWVSGQLFERGLALARITVVPDEFTAMEDALLSASRRARAVICFGGLGPTSDDKTAELVAKLIGGELATHVPSRTNLENFYRQRDRDITAQALKQVLYPQAAEPLLNVAGMAPGFCCRIGQAICFFLPGVPSEMKAMFLGQVWPRLEAELNWETTEEQLLHWTWRCLRVWESELQRLMDPIEKKLPAGAYLGYRTRFPENHLTLYARSGSVPGQLIDTIRQQIGEILKPFCYSDQEEDLEQLVAQRLAATHRRLALVESCTGGALAERLTRRAGASSYFWGSYVTYQRLAKAQMVGTLLNTDAETVGRDVTRRLAEQARAQSKCDVVAAVTGWLGPEGGTEADPLGTIYLCVLGDSVVEDRVVLSTSRTREELAHAAGLYVLEAILLAQKLPS